jgi:hypothetical protein
MAFPEPFCHFLGPLETSGIPYCITGSVAAGIYGETRTTKDIDLVLLLRVDEVDRLRGAFPEEQYYVPPTEVLVNELLRGQRGCLNLFHHLSGFKADLFFVVRDPLHLWAMKHRRRIAYGDEQIWLAPPEYVLLRKLEFFREGQQDKHVRDLRFMLAVTEVDRHFIARHVERLGLDEQWREVLEAYKATGGENPPLTD